MNAVDRYDLIVLGSGSAGLVAGLAASTAGLSVLILEKTDKIGGTTAYSGGGTWIPANHHALDAGISDSVKDAVSYLNATAPDGWAQTESELWRAFAKAAPEALSFIEDNTPLRFELLDLPDVFPDAAGAKTTGRMLSPRLLKRSLIGKWARRIRTSKYPQIFTYSEVYDLGPIYGSLRHKVSMLPKLLWRLFQGERGLGSALVIGLLKGCLDGGCVIVTNARATELHQADDGSVTGVQAIVDGRSISITSTGSVVIATGGYEWDRARLDRHFPGPTDFLASPRANEGDGHRMAEAIGAELSHMDQANINAAIPGKYEGRVQGIGWFHHTAPTAIIVNAAGERFVNEAHDNLGLILDQRGPDNLPINLPAWLISDSRFVLREHLAVWIARCDPTWLRSALSLKRLAEKLGINAGNLGRTVDSYNAAIQQGAPDPFGRENRQCILVPPFVAVPFNRSFISTKGGPRTDALARVLRADSSVIGGLYCAGVAMANPMGTKSISAGTTLGPNLTWGYIAGMAASRAHLVPKPK